VRHAPTEFMMDRPGRVFEGVAHKRAAPQVKAGSDRLCLYFSEVFFVLAFYS
jgi:hypothetical protein